MKKGLLIVVSGFSGAGKGTVVNCLKEQYPGYELSVSVTTRQPREGEIEGVHYFFRSREEFEQMVLENAFIEHATYVEHSYGTPRKFVEDALQSGKNVLLEIEVQGALQVRKQYPDCVLVFIAPPSIQELEKRLTGRGSESPEVIRRRLSRAKEEASWMADYDFLLVNEEADQCAGELDRICTGLAHRVANCRDLIEELLSQVSGL